MKTLGRIIEWGIYLFIFLLPWQTRLILLEGNLNGYWEYGTISIYATEILLWIIFLLTAVRFAADKLKNNKERSGTTVGNSKLFYFVILSFVLYSFISLFGSDSKILALYTWHWLVEGVGLFLVLRTVKFDVVKLAWALVAGAVVQAGLGIWQFLSQSTFSSKWLGMALHDPIEPGTYVVETALRRWLRAYGSLPHPNMLAGFLAAAMFLAFWLYQKIDYGLRKISLSVIFIFLSLGLCATFSKSVIISFGVILIIYWIASFILKYSKEEKIDLLKFTLFFLIVALIFGAVFWDPVSTRIMGQERLEIKSISERVNYFDQAWEIIKNHPFWGVGLGNYTLATHNEINPDLKSWDYQPVHNIYLLVLAELGIAGLILWLMLMAFILLKNSGLNLPVARYALPAAFLMIGFFDHYLWTLYFGIILFWLIFGLFKALDRPLDRS